MAQLNDAQLLDFINQYLPNNDNELITPSVLRLVLAQLVDAKVSADVLTQFAQLANPRFTGVPMVPTAPAGTNSDQVASTAFVQATLVAIASGKNLSELVLPQDVLGGNWYLTSSGFWEARRNFRAEAAPVNGPNWRLLVGFAGQLTTLPVAGLSDATDAGRAMLTAPSAAAQRALVNNLQIRAGQYGNHPGFNTEDGPAGAWAWVFKAISTLMSAQGMQQPEAPTNGVVIDAAKEFTFKVNPAFPSYTQYKESGRPGTTEPAYLSASTAYQVDDIVHVTGLAGAAKLSLGYYVAGSGNIPDGKVLTNSEGFSGSAVVTPPAPVGDTVAPSVTFTVPAAGATLTPDSQVLLTVTANDNVAVSGLTFTNGATGQVIGQGAKNGSTYTFPYTTGAAGPLSLVATATDAAGNSQSATVNVTVQGTTAPTTPSPALTAALAISVASIVAGNSLTFTVTPGGGTAPYSYAVVATNNATGATTVLGSSASGSFTPQTANTSYNIDATVTDSAGKVAQAITRTVQVTAAQSVNQLPVASAGDDLTITAPTSSVALMGTASDPDPGDTLTYLWRPIAGPNTPLGLPATTLNVVVSNLIPGTYQFGFQATDQKGGKSTEDFVVVNVNAAPAPAGKGYQTTYTDTYPAAA
jgi:hypothetical protein